MLLPPEAMVSIFSRNETMFGLKNTYTVSEYLDDLHKDIWTELFDHRPIDTYQRSLQKTFLFIFSNSYILSRALNGQIILPISGRTTFGSHDVESIFQAYFLR